MPSRKGRKSKDNSRSRKRAQEKSRLQSLEASKKKEGEKEAPAETTAKENGEEDKEKELSLEKEQRYSEGQDHFLLDTATKPPTVENLRKSMFEPLRIERFKFKENLAPMFAVFAFAIMLYGITIPRYVTLEDDGLFLMLLHHFGVGHPPGYPLYTLLGTPFYHLMPDIFTPAFRGHMFSGFMGAIACVAIYAIVAMLVRNRVCAFAAGIAYASSEAFWSQAIIAEVYTLNAAMYFIILALCVRFAAFVDVKGKSHLILYCIIAFTYGLALTNHWPLIGLGSIALLMVVFSKWKSLLRLAPLGLLCLAVGLLPYAFLIYNSHTETAINFYGPIEDLKALWFYVTRSGYSGVDNQEGVGLPEKIEFSIFFLNQLQRQITILGLLVAIVGFVAMLRSKIHNHLAVSFLVAWFMTGPLMIILIDFQTEFIWFSAFRRLPPSLLWDNHDILWLWVSVDWIMAVAQA